MSNIVYGYIRVSTKEQNEDRQRIALAEFSVPEENIFIDKLSGKDFNRPQYKEKKADIVVLDMPLLDTRQTGRDLTGTFVADLVLQILSYVAQTERENIKQRQKEGIAAAKLRGVQFSRPRKPIPDNFEQVKTDWEHKRITSREAANQLKVSQDTFLRWVRDR